jgi:hypothetical protein
LEEGGEVGVLLSHVAKYLRCGIAVQAESLMAC